MVYFKLTNDNCIYRAAFNQVYKIITLHSMSERHFNDFKQDDGWWNLEDSCS